MNMISYIKITSTGIGKNFNKYDTVFIEDWDIKRLQRVADARYEELV